MKKKFNIKIADLVVRIEAKYSFVYNMCIDYLTDESKYDFKVSATKEEIEEEKNNSEYDFTSDYCESVCIYRNIVKEMINYDRFLFHSSVVEVNNECYAFSAQSGTGKSTHTNLWLEYFKDSARIINGDKPIVAFKDNKVIVYGTPWCGKECININTSGVLKSICFLKRGSENKIRKISSDEVVDKIIYQVIFPNDSDKSAHLLELMDKMIELVPCYELECNISLDAVKVAYEGMCN